jgi:phosphotransferase system IIB component
LRLHHEQSQQDIDKLIELVGGRENIATVSHCITRLRFVLNDPAIARPKEIEQLRMVKGCFTNAGQFQVVIGTEWAITIRLCWRPPARPPPIKSRPRRPRGRI